jgi:hypothetical protein
MFERYTEKARRVIFFARYEASTLGSPYIEPEHLLLGLLREDPVFKGRLPSGGAEQIRKRIEESSPHREKVSTSVDLPLNADAKRVLAYGAQESEELHHKVIDCGHLVLGLLRLENSVAAAALQQCGFDSTSYREIVSASLLSGERTPKSVRRLQPRRTRSIDRPSNWDDLEGKKPAAPSLQGPIDALTNLVNVIIEHFDAFSDVYGEQRLKRKPWSRKEAFGHLIDCATSHQQWFARALTEPNVIASGYPPDDWVSAQQYGSFQWDDVVDLWLCVNRLLIHVLARIPEEKLETPCHIGVHEPISLATLIERYVAHCEDMVGQILARL